MKTPGLKQPGIAVSEGSGGVASGGTGAVTVSIAAGVVTAKLAKGTGTVMITKTPVGGGTTTDVGTAQASPATYTLQQPADRGYTFGGRAVTASAPIGATNPTIAPQAPTITGITSGTGSVTVAVTRNADNGGDTVVNDLVNVYNGSNDVFLKSATGSGSIVVSGLPNATVYARAGTTGQTNGLGPLSAKSISVAVGLGSASRNNGNMRLFGNQAQIAIPSPITAALNGYVYKLQAPSGAIGARVSVHNKASALGVAYIKAQMAPTDTAAIDTATNAFNPQVAGVVNNSAYNATTNPNGFVKAKWKGAAQSRRIYPSDAVPPSLGYSNQEDTVTSDLISLPPVPIRAKDRTAEEYYYILRLTVGAVANQDGIAGVYATELTKCKDEWVASNGADCSLMYANATGNNDAGDTNYAIPGAVGLGQSPSVSIEWIYPASVQPVTFWHVGDSITESFKWNRWAVQRKSTAARPLHAVNVGGSTTRTKDYLGNMYLLLQTMAKPDYVVLPITSINNYTPTSGFFNLANAQAEYARLVDTYNNLNALGIKMIWWTPVNYVILAASYPPGPGPAGKPTPGDYTSNSWAYLYNKCKEFAAANGIVFMDVAHDARLVWVDQQRYNIPAGSNMTSWNGDNTHPSDPIGMTGFATIYGEALTSLLGY